MVDGRHCISDILTSLQIESVRCLLAAQVAESLSRHSPGTKSTSAKGASQGVDSQLQREAVAALRRRNRIHVSPGTPDPVEAFELMSQRNLAKRLERLLD